jgi:hypothetical protein
VYLDTCGGSQTVDTVVAAGYCSGPDSFVCGAVDDDTTGCGNGLQSSTVFVRVFVVAISDTIYLPRN